MAIVKWIGGFLGYMAGGFLGALAGVFIGSVIDSFIDESDDDSDNAYSGGNERQQQQGQRNSFFFSLLVLASYIIKADGKVMHSEMEFTRRFLRENFGDAAMAQGDQILKGLFEEQKRQGATAFRNTITQCCFEVRMNTTYETRLQLMDFLIIIAKCDGRVPQEELNALMYVAATLGIDSTDFESMYNMGFNYSNYGNYSNQGGQGSQHTATPPTYHDELEAAYKVLGISSSATDQEVKSAYRKMALKHHPDKVATLGEDVRRAAEAKFQEINNAKEIIYKARGL